MDKNIMQLTGLSIKERPIVECRVCGFHRALSEKEMNVVENGESHYGECPNCNKGEING
jgi:hypothetical protein